MQSYHTTHLPSTFNLDLKIPEMKNNPHGNLRRPPQCHPPQQIAGLIKGLSTINHWFPLIRPFLKPYFLGGAP